MVLEPRVLDATVIPLDGALECPVAQSSSEIKAITDNHPLWTYMLAGTVTSSADAVRDNRHWDIRPHRLTIFW